MNCAISFAHSPWHWPGAFAGIRSLITLSSFATESYESRSGGASPPSPISPWQTWHMSWYSAAPLLAA